MKKYQVIVVFFLIMINVIPAKCQDSIVKSERKWGTELNFNPFNGNLSLNNTSGQIKVRRFLNDEIALRIGVLFNFKSFNDDKEQKYTTQPFTSSSSKQSLQTNINFGIEKHFRKGSRLSPYLGAEIGVGFKTAKHEMEFDSKKRTIDGAWENIEYNDSYYSQSFEENNYVSAGCNLLTGFDFYMSENFYFGYEFGFSAEYIKYGKIEITQDTEYSEYSSNPLPEIKSHSWKIAPAVINGIRIGFNF